MDNEAARKEMLIARAAMQRIALLHEVDVMRSAMVNVTGWRYWLSFAANNLSGMFLPAAARTERAASPGQSIGLVEIVLGLVEVVLPRRRSLLRTALRGFRLWQLGSHLFDQLRDKMRHADTAAPEGAEPVAPEASPVEPPHESLHRTVHPGSMH